MFTLHLEKETADKWRERESLQLEKNCRRMETEREIEKELMKVYDSVKYIKLTNTVFIKLSH